MDTIDGKNKNETIFFDPEIQVVLGKYASQRRNLIPILQDVQDVKGYISHDAVKQISRHLCLPTSKIFGVATFYNQFRLSPPGRHLIQICRGTACHVKGSKKILDALEQHLSIKVSQTTKDRKFTLETVACIGACSIAPVIAIDNNFHGRVRVEEIPSILEQYE
ncbi:MAG: NADH-quinone oxidoreductase subunit NuoE [Vulcanimicrobiota bacterium]